MLKTLRQEPLGKAEEVEAGELVLSVSSQEGFEGGGRGGVASLLGETLGATSQGERAESLPSIGRMEENQVGTGGN